MSKIDVSFLPRFAVTIGTLCIHTYNNRAYLSFGRYRIKEKENYLEGPANIE